MSGAVSNLARGELVHVRTNFGTLISVFLDRAPPGPQEQRGLPWRRARASRGFTHIFRRYNSTSTTYGLQVLKSSRALQPPHLRSVTTDESQPGPQSRVCDAAGVSRRAPRIFEPVGDRFSLSTNRCSSGLSRVTAIVQPGNRADRIDSGRRQLDLTYSRLSTGAAR